MAATPLMQQYYEIKKQNPGCILFFRMGDFFELFEEDAVVASKILGLLPRFWGLPSPAETTGRRGRHPFVGFRTMRRTATCPRWWPQAIV